MPDQISTNTLIQTYTRPRCERCGGSLVREWADEPLVCLNCGHRPLPEGWRALAYAGRFRLHDGPRHAGRAL